MAFRHILLAGGIALLLFSCSKDKSVEPDQDQPLKDSTFQPVAAGSTWHYQDSLQGNFTLTSTDQDTVVDGISYHVFMSQQDTSSTIIPTYFGKSGINYYGRGLISALQDISLLYMKDTLVNSSWSQEISVDVPSYGNVSATVQSELTAINTTRTVNGKHYTNVSEVTFKINIPVPVVGDITYATGSWYAARGVGLIALDIQNNNAMVGSLSLLDYTIK